MFNDLVTHRTPRDDAPSYDASMWAGKDCAYITQLLEQLEEQHRVEGTGTSRPSLDPFGNDGRAGFSASSSGTTTTAAPGESLQSEAIAAFHTVPLAYPRNFFSRMLRALFPTYYYRWQNALTSSDLRSLSAQDLLTLMQLALASGERDRSSAIAQELSRRRVNISLHAEEPHRDRNMATGGQQATPSWEWATHTAPPQAAPFSPLAPQRTAPFHMNGNGNISSGRSTPAPAPAYFYGTASPARTATAAATSGGAAGPSWGAAPPNPLPQGVRSASEDRFSLLGGLSGQSFGSARSPAPAGFASATVPGAYDGGAAVGGGLSRFAPQSGYAAPRSSNGWY